MCTFHLCTVDILHTFNTLLPSDLPTNVEGTRVKLVGHGIPSHVFIENSPLPVCKICTSCVIAGFSLNWVCQDCILGEREILLELGFGRIAVRSFYFERERERERESVCVCDSAENSSRKLTKAPLA
jgi:hypothetical protein